MVETYFRALAAEVRQLLSGMGIRSIDEIVGAVHRLRPKTPEAKQYLSGLLDPVDVVMQRACLTEEDSTLHLELNRTADESNTLASRRRRFRITNADRAIGAHLSGQKLRSAVGLDADGSDKYEFVGTAGQSFGAFLIAGLNFRLVGEANDYVGKGLSGGVIAISAGEEASLRGDVLAGNTVLYGATSGELYVAGHAGERFAVRNSGALSVVEGVGLHACEYMTAGISIILGPAGMNLGAGMTGGLCYLLRDSIGGLGYNEQSVRLAPLEVREELWLRRVLRRHVRLTGSPRALRLLNADLELPFLRVEPVVPPCSVTETWAAILARFKRQATSVWNLPHSVYGNVAAVV
jgi:glutamate synthase domain-containing protein 3